MHNELRKTKIICTIGPATSSYVMLEKMYHAGMNVVRLNMSHGSHQSHEKVIRSIKNINQKIKDSIPVLLDTQGPEIRTGNLQSDLHLQEGDEISISVRPENVEQSSFHINYEDLINTVSEGEMITVDNGLINLQILRKDEGALQCRVIDGGRLTSKRHVNLPGIRVNLPSITEKDRNDILFGVEQEVDFIALSFVREAADVLQLKELLGQKAQKIKVISKIEDRQGVNNIEEIIDVSDGIMVARGDLGIEINIEELPNIQRTIVRKCHERGKRVIVATHLLESMIENPIPTRAEVTDVANAIYEEVDAVMLSGETTVGKYPVKCIEHLDKIARASEKLPGLNFSRNLRKTDDRQHVAATAVGHAEAIDASGIVVITRRGITANFVTNCRPFKTHIYAFTNDNRTRRQLFLNRSVTAHRIAFSSDPEKTIQTALGVLKKREGFSAGERVVVISDIIAESGISSIQIRSVI
ncbi:MAG: pyruvate kinase [Candidatus Dadabacteria bacterium]|nr:pyruvate kinase [Candidatus Dadabacteria bacterium]NIS07591.1 pyruvate kinase [Candidatus Dadabacteria bacterium]NIY21225.1 pyruvate kinase [Candidatus Dadabacteria bacterium]